MNYTLKVAKIRRENDDTVTLCFKQPGLKKIHYKAGQYLTLIFRINGRRYIRPYSFSSCPGLDTFLEVTVKRVINGIVSNHINDTIQEGDSIEAMSPMGDFVYEPESTFTDVYLWGVGSGITPLISIAKFILAFKDDVKVHLLYGNRNMESTILLDQIETLLNKFRHNFSVKHFHTKLVVEDIKPFLIQGRIDETKALKILNENSDLSNTAHYICGPAGLKESVNAALSATIVKANNIFSEDFELIKDPADFKDIHTQSVNIQFDNRQHTLEVAKGMSILEAALNADIELPYSCQTGNCSSCKGRLIEGEAKMIGLRKDRDDLKKDEILLCCSHPLTQNVYIAI